MILATHAPRGRPRGPASGAERPTAFPCEPRATLHAGGAPRAHEIAEMRYLRFEVVDQGHLMGRGAMVKCGNRDAKRDREIRPHAQSRRAQQTPRPPATSAQLRSATTLSAPPAEPRSLSLAPTSRTSATRRTSIRQALRSLPYVRSRDRTNAKRRVSRVRREKREKRDG